MQSTPAEVVHTWFEEVWNQGLEATIDRLLAPTAVAHGLPTSDGLPMAGPEAFKPFYRTFRGTFPDIQVRILHAVSEGEFCAVRCAVTGTHSGDALGVPATGNAVSFSGMTIVRVRDGQIHEGWNTFDFLQLYQQLGVLPPLT